MNKLLVFCLIINFSFSSYSQSTNTRQNKVDSNLLDTKPHFSFTIIPYLTQKALITTETGNYTPTTSNAMGGEIGINYHLYSNNSYSILLGLHAGAGSRNHQLFIPKEDFSPALEHDIIEKGRFTHFADLYFSIPILIERKWKLKNENYWNMVAGINVRHVIENFSHTQYFYPDANGQMIQVEDFDLMIGNDRKPWLNYNLGGGYVWLLHNKNFLSVNLLGNLSTTDMVHGKYTINVTGKEPASGRYTANYSFIGLSVNYILTRVKN